MYTLRQINAKGVQSNRSLGDHYQVIHRDYNKEEFERSKYVKDLRKTDNESANKIHALILFQVGDYQQVWPLYEGFNYYIMTPKGDTFDNLTVKN